MTFGGSGRKARERALATRERQGETSRPAARRGRPGGARQGNEGEDCVSSTSAVVGGFGRSDFGRHLVESPDLQCLALIVVGDQSRERTRIGIEP